MSAFEVADRVRVVAAGWTGSVVGVELNDDLPPVATVHVLLDGQGISGAFHVDELERYEGPAVEPEPPAVPAQPIRPGLPGVGDALLSLAGILGAQLPDNPVVHAKLAELKVAVESAMPASTIEDGHGNGWKLCGPGCDLEVVRPGKVQCSGRVCGEAVGRP